MIKEDAPTNNVGSGAIAGTVGDPPVSRKAQRKIQRREKSTPTPVIINMMRRKAPVMAEECETFAGAVVFEVSTEVFYNTKNQKRKHKTWRKYLEEDDCLAEIREYANKHPHKPIVLKNRTTGEMLYARYGKRG